MVDQGDTRDKAYSLAFAVDFRISCFTFLCLSCRSLLRDLLGLMAGGSQSPLLQAASVLG